MNADENGPLKICIKCHQSLPLDQFHRRTRARDGHDSQCKGCRVTWYAANAEKRRAQHKAWRLANPEQVRARGKARYAAHREQARTQDKEWCVVNPEKKLARNHQRRARKNGAAINDFTADQWREMKQLFHGRCAYCGKKARLTQDHILPLSKGGNHTANNIVPACQSCNSKKGTGGPLASVQPVLLI